MNDEKKISVIIPTHNRLSSLKECLLSILENNYPDFEIIIIDDFSNDGTREYLQKIKNQKVKIILNEENLGVSEARNVGIRIATGEWVAFIDDDCRAGTDWLVELAKGFQDKEVGFVIGNTIYFQENYIGNFPERLVNNCNAKWPGAGNVAYRRNVLEYVGGFDGKNFPYANEDTELALRVFSSGWKYERNKEAKVYHQKSFWNVKSLWRSAHNFSAWAKLKKKYPKIFKEFGPNVVFGIFLDPKEYLYIILFPLLLILLAGRYFFMGQKDWRVFFAKWPCWLILKRFYIWQAAIKEKSLVL